MHVFISQIYSDITGYKVGQSRYNVGKSGQQNNVHNLEYSCATLHVKMGCDFQKLSKSYSPVDPTFNVAYMWVICEFSTPINLC